MPTTCSIIATTIRAIVLDLATIANVEFVRRIVLQLSIVIIALEVLSYSWLREGMNAGTCSELERPVYVQLFYGSGVYV